MAIAFFSGELMRPEIIRAADPDAIFLGRAHITINDGESPDGFADVLADEIWGIAVNTSARTEAVEAELVLDSGQTLSGVLAEPLLGGNAKSVLSNARYWELPPAYVERLASIIEVGPDEG